MLGFLFRKEKPVKSIDNFQEAHQHRIFLVLGAHAMNILSTFFLVLFLKDKIGNIVTFIVCGIIASIAIFIIETMHKIILNDYENSKWNLCVMFLVLALLLLSSFGLFLMKTGFFDWKLFRILGV